VRRLTNLTDDEKSGRVGESIAYSFKLRMTEKSSQMDGWMELVVFSKRELAFTFAICYRPSICRLSVCRLSSVCKAHAPYSGRSNFWQYFYGIRYIGHLLISAENFTRSSQANASTRGVKHKGGSQV